MHWNPFLLFNGDRLRRVIFEPGKVIEKKTFSVTGKELLQLNSKTVVPGIIDLFGLRIKVIKKAGNMGFMFDGEELIETRFNFGHPLFISNPLYPVGTELIIRICRGQRKKLTLR